MQKRTRLDWRETFRQPAKVPTRTIRTPIGHDNAVSITIIGRSFFYADDLDIVIEHLRWYQGTLKQEDLRGVNE